MAALKKKPVAQVDSRRLPKDYDSKFSTLITCYERKEYKRGHKIADEILKKFPNHGETQAMKGLVYNCEEGEENKEKAHEWIKLGLKNDIRSHVCWHVYGLIHRSDNNYKEASKCYLNALRINPSNTNILRDLGFLQIQLRDFDAFVNSRRKILENKSNIRTNWVALAMGYYAAGRYSDAYTVVDKCNECFKDDNSTDPYEVSEMLLFQNRCVEAEGKYAEAIEHLGKCEPKIVDKLSMHLTIAKLLQLSGKFDEAQAKWLFLLKDQPENYRYHTGFQSANLDLPSSCLHLSALPKAALLKSYEHETFEGKYTATTMRKIRFTLLEGEELDKSLKEHIKAGCRKGVPALYQDICHLARKQDDTGSTQVLCRDPRNLRDSETFEGTGPAEQPVSLLYTLVLQGHLLEKCGELEQSMLYIDECLAHTPTATDFYLRKARIFKKMGNLNDAAIVADQGRALDLQDRYLNNKATKYAFRANKIAEGYDLMSMFARHEGDPQMYLAEMQCNWYELVAGEAYSRDKQWGRALKKFYSIEKHFSDYVENMFEFHGFCVRKTSLRAHSDAMRTQDKIFSHPFYQRACRGAVQIFLHLLDEPDDIDGLGHLSKQEKKKERERRKKAKAKADKEEAERVEREEEEARRFGNTINSTRKADPDRDGDKYLSRNFLEEAANFVGKLSQLIDHCEPATSALVSEVYVRKSKAVQAIRVLSQAFKKHPGHPELTPALIRLHMRLTTKTSKSQKVMSQNPQVMAIVKDCFKEPHLFGTLTAAEYVNNIVSAASVAGTSVQDRLGAARCKMALEAYQEAGRAAVSELLGSELLWDAQSRGLNVKEIEKVIVTVRDAFAMPDLATKISDCALAVWPTASKGVLGEYNAVKVSTLETDVVEEIV
eukprot:GSChrysophyteH1.ASY1.ANO1.795.1 assembled CDS